ncbi:MAG TPA: aminoglycoside phosphotransferase family protein [Thermomicrobiales bacterium]|nr:aminoglycoside phosphotransferase family protein [Thermomicrobiales bacterium]
MSNDDATTGNAVPPAAGVRLQWADLPEHLQGIIEEHLGSRVVSAWSQPSGFSPGVAARLTTASGQRVFVKAVSSEPNPESPEFHRREARIVPALPLDAPVPRLLWSHDEGDGGWVVLMFEDVEGREPLIPWRTDELDRVVDAIVGLSDALTPSPLDEAFAGTTENWGIFRIGWWQRIEYDRPAGLDDWSLRNLASLIAFEAEASQAVAGNTLLHLDLRADNLLVTDERVLVVDWPHARIGAPWLDIAFFIPSLRMQGGPPPEEVFARHPAARAADPDAVNAAIAAIAGFFTRQSLQPPPPGLPTLRAFQAAQGVVSRRWLAERTGWR